MIVGNKRRGGVRGTELLLYGLVVVLLAAAAGMQHQRLSKLEFRHQLFRQRIKLPSAEVLRIATLGYDQIYANWLWLQSIQAFGSGWITDDGTTEPIYQYFDTMTDLDPNFVPSYRFGNLIIGDNRKDMVRGQRLLRKGSLKLPHNYDIPYLGMYNAIFQSNDLIDARWFAIRLRRIPNAPGFMKRMEEYIERQDGRFELAFEINVRYYIQYLLANNDIEREIIERRMISVIDSLARQKMARAAWAYADDHDGNHPVRMEDILDPRYLPDFDTPDLNLFQYALGVHEREINTLSAGVEPPEELIQSITDLSTRRVTGLPPEPNGTWYLIWTPAREYFEKVIYEPGMARTDNLHYIRSAYELLKDADHQLLRAQEIIMSHYAQHGEKPADEKLQGILGRDALGGHFVYQRDAPESPTYGVVYTTSGRRVSEGREPRLGLTGRGPFPFSIEPSILDHPDDYAWAIRQGYIQPDGTELWYLAHEEPDWEKLRRNERGIFTAEELQAMEEESTPAEETETPSIP